MNIITLFSPVGWLLGFIMFYINKVTNNYGLTLILFSVLVKVCMIPLGIQQQKGLISSARMQPKMKRLQKAYADGELCYDVTRDNDGNVTGYKKYLTYTGQVYENKVGMYHYHPIRNKTNFDFSAYFGYWGVEQFVALTYRAPYQLAAFGMLGSTSQYLPYGIIERDADGKNQYIYGEWVFDNSDYPVSYVDTEGRKTEITYCE